MRGRTVIVLGMLGLARASFAITPGAADERNGVVRVRTQKTSGGFSCTGSYIDWGVVVTAAHCLEDLKTPTDPTTVVVQFVQTSPMGTTIFQPPVVSWETMQQWRTRTVGSAEPRSRDNDLAVIQLEYCKTPPGTKALAFPQQSSTANPMTGETATIVGYDGSPADAPVRLNGTTTISGAVEPLALFTMPAAGQSVTCLGDSGGPLLITRNGAELVAGVISGVQMAVGDCAGTMSETSYTRVDSSLNHQFWLQAYLGAQLAAAQHKCMNDNPPGPRCSVGRDLGASRPGGTAAWLAVALVVAVARLLRAGRWRRR